MTCEVFIPFPGFYESWLSQELDSIVEYELEEYPERSWEDYHYDFQKLAREYLDVYNGVLREELSSTPPIFFKGFEFKELISPREYNFTTDRLLAIYHGSPSDLLLVRRLLCGLGTLHEDIAQRFASRPGFASFYGDFVANWRYKPIGEWDANELSILLPEFGRDMLLDDLREPLNECVIYEGELESELNDLKNGLKNLLGDLNTAVKENRIDELEHINSEVRNHEEQIEDLEEKLRLRGELADGGEDDATLPPD